jgi:hypothetical protein
MRTDPAAIASAAAEIRNMLSSFADDIDGDDDARADLLEGQTGLHEIAALLADLYSTAIANVAAIDMRLEDLKSRKERFKARSARTKEALQLLLEAADARKLDLPQATISLRSVPPAVIVDVDATVLPDVYQRVKVEADKTAIKAALEAGQTVPGARLTNGGQTVAIRTA